MTSSGLPSIWRPIHSACIASALVPSCSHCRDQDCPSATTTPLQTIVTEGLRLRQTVGSSTLCRITLNTSFTYSYCQYRYLSVPYLDSCIWLQRQLAGEQSRPSLSISACCQRSFTPRSLSYSTYMDSYGSAEQSVNSRLLFSGSFWLARPGPAGNTLDSMGCRLTAFTQACSAAVLPNAWKLLQMLALEQRVMGYTSGSRLH